MAQAAWGEFEQLLLETGGCDQMESISLRCFKELTLWTFETGCWMFETVDTLAVEIVF
jgi:hypothetical protein